MESTKADRHSKAVKSQRDTEKKQFCQSERHSIRQRFNMAGDRALGLGLEVAEAREWAALWAEATGMVAAILERALCRSTRMGAPRNGLIYRCRSCHRRQEQRSCQKSRAPGRRPRSGDS